MNHQVIMNDIGTNIIRVSYGPSLPSTFMQDIQTVIQEKIHNYGSFQIYLDLKGLNITTLSRNIPWIENIMSNFNANTYEPQLEHVYIFNAPFIAKPVYSLISRFVRNIKGKITFVPKEKQTISEVFQSRFSTTSSSV
jgi:CRAL/TRIO domain